MFYWRTEDNLHRVCLFKRFEITIVATSGEWFSRMHLQVMTRSWFTSIVNLNSIGTGGDATSDFAGEAMFWSSVLDIVVKSFHHQLGERHGEIKLPETLIFPTIVSYTTHSSSSNYWCCWCCDWPVQLIESTLSQDGHFSLLQTHHDPWVNDIVKPRASKPGQDNVNNIRLRKSDPNSSLIL